jgi:hypothetical protein
VLSLPFVIAGQQLLLLLLRNLLLPREEEEEKVGATTAECGEIRCSPVATASPSAAAP